MVVDDPLRDALDARGVGDGRATVLLDDDSHDETSLGGRGRLPGHRRPRGQRRGGGLLIEHLIGGGDVLVLAGELGVEAVVGDHREQRVERDAGQVAPRGDVGELPPPQRLGDVALAVVAQAGLEVAGDAGEVVGELALDHLRDVGVEDVAVGVEVVEHLGQPQPHLVEVGLGADVGLVLLARLEVPLGAEPGARERDLADLEQQQRDRPADVALPGDLAQREQEARERVRHALGEVLRLAA